MRHLFQLTHSRLSYFLLIIFSLYSELFPQNQIKPFDHLIAYSNKLDKCGYDEVLAKQQLAALGDHWGYGYDSLLVDLNYWSKSPYLKIDSIGASVQNRALWQLTITSDNPVSTPRKTVFIHARTHANEVQAWWVTDELIEILLSEEDFAQFMRENCTFYFVPMYNPDGVELEFPRQNANGIDIESNWDKNPVEPEAAVLRNRFSELMLSDSPIECALNMHSSTTCKRYFVYHDARGTSVNFTLLEQDFISGVKSYFEKGIEPWHYYISWKNGTPLYYPESWFWLNFGETVMALTYEDMNCATAGEYSKTAFALLHGIADYLDLVTTVVLESNTRVPENFRLYQNFPNPVRLTRNLPFSTIIQYEINTTQSVRLALYDILGRQVKILDEGIRSPDVHRVYFDASSLPNGTYIYQLESPNGIHAKQLTIMK